MGQPSRCLLYTSFQDSCTVYVALRRSQHRFDIRHYWLQVLTLVEEHSVPVAYLSLPILLPLAQCALLQQAVSLDDELRSRSLESYTTLFRSHLSASNRPSDG